MLVSQMSALRQSAELSQAPPVALRDRGAVEPAEQGDPGGQ
jgi:hypothetical protein